MGDLKQRTKLTSEQAAQVGKMCREAIDGNLIVGSFAAEMIGESYPLSKAMCDILFAKFSDEELGKKFETWMEETRIYIK